MSNIFIQLPVVSQNARVALNQADVAKLYTSTDYEYRYFPFESSLYSNDLSDKLVPKSNSIFNVTSDHLYFENSAVGNAIASAFIPPDDSRFFVSGVFTVKEFPSLLGMLLGNFNNPSGATLGFTFYVNGPGNRNLTVLFGGSAIGVVSLTTLNKPIYVSAFVDKYNKHLDYFIVAEDQTFKGQLEAQSFTDSGLPISIGNTMQAQIGDGKYNCYDFVSDNLNRYSDLTRYYNDTKERMSRKGITI
ncbi:hypothetical protein RMB12_14450 [Acinetobacter sp. V117_2]|uniref:hypothetical protein n=1 Tax=Acinetobacter sp. V117_2 TaxID=3072989 RepID=UPI00287CB9B9|nr:hypothetical protein [Acinetobacter sp. V117_2]MDS7968221.1 hypothetical protein [Acinetobacter sp. V117_2]